LFSPSQIRAGRALTGLSQAEVAERAGVSIPTVKRAESESGIQVTEDTVALIAKVLQKAGIEFIAENGGGAGVRLVKRSSVKHIR
jgi:transcriptional regulator with XRE-family HTH domain